MATDMHCHTKTSDGSTSIEDVISIAKHSNITSFAITDHDTFDGAYRATLLGEKFGVNVITGIEVSTFDYKRGRKAHILGYLPDCPKKLDRILGETNRRRFIAGQEMIRKVTKEFKIPTDIIIRCGQGSVNIFKQHIMHALMLSGYTEKIFGELYGYLFNEKNGIAYSDVVYPDVLEVVEALHSAGAIAVLAHPSVYDSMELLDDLIEIGIDGVEIYHPRNKNEDVEKLIQIAEDSKLLSLGGTDFHGMYTKHANPLGTCMTSDENMRALYERKKNLTDKKV